MYYIASFALLLLGMTHLEDPTTCYRVTSFSFVTTDMAGSNQHGEKMGKKSHFHLYYPS